MAKILLRSGSLDDFLALGENGQAVFDSALQIRETLRLRKQQAIADSLAIPQPNDDGDRVDWYAPQDGVVVSWAQADKSQRQKALRYLDSNMAGVAALSQRCQQAEKTAIRLFGSLLSRTLQFPGSQHVYLINGRPVITFWGFVNLNQSAREDVFDCLRVSESDEPVIRFVPEPEPEPEAKPQPASPLPVSEPVSKPDEPVLQPAANAGLENPAHVTESEGQPAKAKTTLRRWGFALAATAAAVVATPLAWHFLSTSAPQPLAIIKAEVKPTAPAPAPLQAAPAINKPETTLPLVNAEISVPASPVTELKPAAKSADTPVNLPKNTLILPANAVKIGSTKFLNGTWRVSLNVNDPVTGKPPSLRYQIADNKGTAQLVHGDKVTCKARVFSGLMQSGTLMIKTRSSARCSDGSRYPMPEIACTAGAGGVATCSGRYEGGTVVPMTFKKVSD